LQLELLDAQGEMIDKLIRHSDGSFEH
jgi:hypothetical protein